MPRARRRVPRRAATFLSSWRPRCRRIVAAAASPRPLFRRYLCTKEYAPKEIVSDWRKFHEYDDNPPNNEDPNDYSGGLGCGFDLGGLGCSF